MIHIKKPSPKLLAQMAHDLWAEQTAGLAPRAPDIELEVYSSGHNETYVRDRATGRNIAGVKAISLDIQAGHYPILKMEVALITHKPTF